MSDEKHNLFEDRTILTQQNRLIFTAPSTGAKIEWDGEVPLLEKKRLPWDSGIYAVFHGDQALYVGKSGSINWRWQTGMYLYGGKWDHLPAGELTIRWVLTPDRPTREQEQWFINELRPTANRMMAT